MQTLERMTSSEYRAGVQRWIADHVPEGWAENLTGEDAYISFQRWWLGELHSGGYAVPHWPAEFGGGATLAEQVILHEEMARAGAPEPHLYFVTLHHAALTILEHGTDEQVRRHLKGILEGEVWCQGFSEPDAGSDLAGLRTRAERRGDHYVVNGHKLWSSFAAHADWCLLLVRTDTAAPKRKGISYLLLDMHTPGVEVRPIRQATGDSEFGEIFLTDVEIPVANRLGVEGDGWRVAQTTMSVERGPTVLSLQARLREAFDGLVALAAARGHAGEPGVRQELARGYAEVEILRLLCYRMLQRIEAGGPPGADSSIIKVFYSELLARLMDLGVRLDGAAGQLARPPDLLPGWTSGHWFTDLVGSFAWTIAGGTNEIQRTVIGERTLGLPREPQTVGA